MANENLKKFLDSAGVSHLWTKIDKKVKDEIEKEAERIDNKIGVVPNDSEGNARTVVKYIQDLTDGIVTDGVITELRKDVDTNTGNITALQNAAKDYATKNELKDYETVVNANKVREDLAQYKIDNDAALAKVKETADAAANAEDVEAALNDKANQDEFAEVQTLVNNFFAEEADVSKKLDQLVEIVEYLNKHEEDAGGIIEDVAAIETKVNNLLNMGNNADGDEYTITTYVSDKINERLNIGNKTVKEYVANIIGDLGDKTVSDYVDTVIQEFKNGDFAAATEKITKLEEAVDELERVVGEISLEGYATEQYVQNYVATNVIALTNAEIDTAIGATQN